jgi:predicted lipoprotein with Yx(FWY)xxD motif
VTRVLATAATCACLAIVGCGGDDDSASEDSGGAPATTATEASKEEAAAKGGGEAKQATGGGPGSVVEVNDSEYGQILTDGNGRTLYLFDKEQTDRSQCFGACAEAWPPLFTGGAPESGSGAKDDLLGTTDHEGKTQVTYNGHPLYYYEGESEAGEVLCQGVDEFGGLWLVVDPSGNAIQ